MINPAGQSNPSMLEQLLENRSTVRVEALDTQHTKELQQLLSDAGFLKEEQVDGRMGAVTKKAFRAFKDSVWLNEPAWLGKSSLEKLRSCASEGKRDKPSIDFPLFSVKGKRIIIPCTNTTVYTDEPIIPNGSFTWGEATRSGERIPSDSEIVEGIVRVARLIQPYRDRLNTPFLVTSWYRPPHINRTAGGARYSRHLVGDAIDFTIPGYSSKSVIEQFRQCPGGLGIYHNMPNVIHFDARPGGAVRWGGAPWP